MDDGKLVRWLTLENDKDSDYKPVGKDQSGSGFVIGEKVSFSPTSTSPPAGLRAYEDFPTTTGRAARFTASGSTDRHDTERNIDLVHSLTDWVPESGGYIFESGRPYTISNGQREFYGRNDLLTVQFPGTRIGVNATLLRTSIDADVAEVKIDIDPRFEQA